MQAFPKGQLHFLQVGCQVGGLHMSNHSAYDSLGGGGKVGMLFGVGCSLHEPAWPVINRLHAPLATPPPQYESLTRPDGMGGELAQLKAFLGIDPALPSSQLPLTNYKHVHTGHGPDAVRPASSVSSPEKVVHGLRFAADAAKALLGCKSGRRGASGSVDGNDSVNGLTCCSWAGTGS